MLLKYGADSLIKNETGFTLFENFVDFGDLVKLCLVLLMMNLV